jgi:PAS domain S-box-containing protein
MNKKLKLILIFFFSFAVAIILLFKLIIIYESSRVNTILDTHTLNIKNYYEILSHNQKLVSDIAFEQTMTNEVFINLLQKANIAHQDKNIQLINALRIQARDLLSENYFYLKKRGVLQYHFVFPDNKVFLRMHKPGKYDDDLSGIRSDFEYVNRNLKVIRGFAQGRTSHAFRNVYPILDKNNTHLGAVEISFSSELLQKYFTDVSHLHTHFLVRKDIFDSHAWTRDDLVLKYHQSSEHPNYMITMTKEHTVEKCIKKNKNILQPKLQAIDSLLAKEAPFSIYVKHQNRTQITSFYPVLHNITKEPVAWIVSYSMDPLLDQAIKNTKIILGVSFTGLLLLFAFLYFLFLQKDLLKNIVDKKTCELKDLNNTLEEEVKKQTADLRQKKNLLAESEFRWKFAVEGSGDGLWDWNIKNSTVFFSPQWKKMLGFTEDEIQNSLDEWEKRVHPNDLEKVHKDISDHMEGRTDTYQNEHRVQCKNGRYKWILDRGIIVQRDEDGKPERFIGTHVDIQWRKEVEKQLSDEKEKFRNFLALATDGIHILDTGGNVVECSQSFANALGYSYEEALKLNVRSWDAQFPVEDLTAIIKDLIKHPSTFETRHKRKDGTLIDVQISARGINIEGQEYLYASARDITVQKAQKKALEQAKLEADSANQAKSEFLANMSHEIRTPMNGIIGMINLLLDSELNKEQITQAQIVKYSADALLTVINDILDFSKIEAGKLELEPIDFNMGQLLSDFSATIALRCEEKNLEFICLDTPVLNKWYRADPGRIRQILTNLVGNAIKFTEAGEISIHVTIASHSNNQEVIRFEINDTGIGIEQEKAAHLFDRFTQADSSTTRNYGGTGLGLSISKQLCELMNGNIGVESESGKGSKFWFTVQLETLNTHHTSHFTQLPDLRQEKILVVDDNATNRIYMEQLLDSWEIENTVVTSGSEALDELQSALEQNSPYSISFIDMQMPQMDGFELCSTIRGKKQFSNLRTILLTSQGQRGDAKKAKSIGFNAYISKPVNPSDIYNMLLQVSQVTSQKESLVTRYNSEEAVRLHARILVVEDNIINQKVAGGMLKKLGINVDYAANGQEALSLLKTIDYDLIFMDCQMPVMDGYEASRAIRSGDEAIINHDIPIVAMTANAMKGDKEKCIASGMNDYIAKPIKPDILRAAIEKWIKPE